MSALDKQYFGEAFSGAKDDGDGGLHSLLPILTVM